MDNLTNLSFEINQLHADLCSALADPTRILALYLLAEQPYTVTELTSKLGVTQPTASRHLKILRDRGLVQATRRGQTVEYSLRDARLIDALDTLRAVLRESISYRASLMVE
jgi:DNA-binding transcriptional ArsR family regulator